MKKIYRITLMLVCCMLLRSYAINADPNMDGGGSGGGTQAGTSQNYYSSGDDGVRITIIDVKTKCRAEGTHTIDYYRKEGKNEKKILHFGKVCKIEYMGTGGYTIGRNLVQSDEKYLTNTFHTLDLPTIVSNSNSTSNIETIKDYFNNEKQLRGIASRTGLSYGELISGKYKVMIEPMLYLTFQGNYMAMTAHEAAKLDMALGGTLTSGGGLRAKFVSFTHKNLPLSIFLKKKDLGIRPWTGSKNSRVQNGSILSYLGVGILNFAPEGNEVDLDTSKYVYRPDTDVITAIDVSVTGGNEDGATCDNPLTVQFSNPYFGTRVVTGITVPQGGSRPVWIKWHTPNVTNKVVTSIEVTMMGGAASSTHASIPVTISPLVRKEPINPAADDTKPKSFVQNSSPSFPTTSVLSKFSSHVTSTSWHTYTCTKRRVIDYYDTYYVEDEWFEVPVYKTVYEYSVNTYSSRLISTTVKVKPDSSTKGARQKSNSIKSGYGIEVEITSNVSGSSANCTGVQSACVYFPEFNYKRYRRDAKLSSASLLSTLTLPVNQYSLNGSRVHFTPIWYPDGNYKVYAEVFDAWTPGGMLCSSGTGNINIAGNMWDDWYIRKMIEMK
ncbi:hypothetical protein [[Clostridium] polysaccharolyticum]|uniref:Uncharacterized protein n=1 Tax=[Clostridium] polysaccharolyticum TaxID=29364 RepID=A0A1H9Y979_9FIRM|nr:hypothetical protein [[Clostridium] polysaccharolyticum]SES65401.1 hypothetical protein SAMN04487772_101225 [[Clostridium] polysaccharolyticum]